MKPRVLVLDDEANTRDLVQESLQQENYEVVTAGTIAEVESARREKDFDIYVLDVIVPDGNGLQLAREIRHQSQAGIILLTGLGDEIDRVVGLEIGADDYVVKPFRQRELRARINAVYRRVSGSPVPATAHRPDAVGILFDGLQLFPESRSLRNAVGAEIDLTTLEFDVLHVLLRHANRVLSRDQIMTQVRGQDWSAYDRAIDGLISRIRGKLYPGGNGAQKIKTIRNIGYMLSTSDEVDTLASG